MNDPLSALRGRPRRCSPASVHRQLGALLVIARQQAGHTQESAAKALPMAKRKLQWIETADKIPTDADLDRLLPLYDVPPARQPAWHDMADEARERDWWDRYSEEDLPASSKKFIGLEQGAVRLRTFEPLLFHGQLQTPAYRAALVAGMAIVPRPAEQIQAMLEVSRRRQQALFDPEPLHLAAIVDEAALHRTGAIGEVMRDQLRHVADLAEVHDHITVQVIPASAGFHPGLAGPFSLLEFGWPDDPGFVYVEPLAERPTYLRDRRDIYGYSAVFDGLAAFALPPTESVHMLREVAGRRSGPE